MDTHVLDTWLLWGQHTEHTTDAGSQHILSWKRLTGLKLMENWGCADCWFSAKEKTKKNSEVLILIL